MRSVSITLLTVLLLTWNIHAQQFLTTLQRIDVGLELKTVSVESEDSNDLADKGLPFIAYRAGQGIASDGSGFYTSSGALSQDRTIYRYSPIWGANNIVAENEINVFDYAASLAFTHIGDVAVDGNYVYAPLSDYFPEINLNRSKLHLAWFDRSSLAYAGHLDVSHWVADYGLGSGDIAGVAVYEGRLYVIEYQRTIYPNLYSLPLNDGAPAESGIRIYEIESLYANGIDFQNGLMVVSHDPTNDDGESLLDVYDMDGLTEGSTASPIATYKLASEYRHGEGVTFNGPELWIADGHYVRQIENPIGALADDTYEPNNTLAQAYDVSSAADSWLRDMDGFGVQTDDDWYRILVSSGFERVIIDCDFVDGEGDIDISLVDSSGTTLASSTSATNDERIDFTVGGEGTYYIRVYYGNDANMYDLRWNTISPTTTPPSTPTGVNATDGEFENYIRITWNNVANAIAFRIFRATSPNGDYKEIDTVDADVTSYNDPQPCGGDNTFFYRVTAFNDGGASPRSEFDSGFTSLACCPLPGTPSSVSASDGAYVDFIRIEWGSVDNATQYRVYRGPNSNFDTAVEIAATSDTFWDDYGDKGAAQLIGIGQFPGARMPLAYLALVALLSFLVFKRPLATRRVSYATMTVLILLPLFLASCPLALPPPQQGATYYYWVRAVNDCGDGIVIGGDPGAFQHFVAKLPD